MKTSFAFTRPARTLAPLALAAALAGCSMAPKYDRPAAPIDTAYPSGAAYVELAAATPDDESSSRRRGIPEVGSLAIGRSSHSRNIVLITCRSPCVVGSLIRL